MGDKANISWGSDSRFGHLLQINNNLIEFKESVFYNTIIEGAEMQHVEMYYQVIEVLQSLKSNISSE